jgi:hypothetical protein
MKKEPFIKALKELGLKVAESNGILWVSSAEGVLMVFRIRFFYTKLWIKIHFTLYREVFELKNWKEAYQKVINHKNQNPQS